MNVSGFSVGGAVRQRSIAKSPRVMKTFTRDAVNKTVGERRPLSGLNEMGVRYFPLAAVFTGVLCLCQSYTLRSSVSWVVPSNDVVEDPDLSEEDAPALLVESAGLWKQAYPSSTVLGDSVESPGELKSESDNMAQLSSRLFSYRLKKVKKSPGSSPPPHQETARTARYIAHYSDWGYLATISTQDKVITRGGNGH